MAVPANPIKAHKLGYIIFILLLGIPMVEIGVFIEVGGLIGLWPTIAVIFITAAIDTGLLRAQGLAVMYRALGQEDQARLMAQRSARLRPEDDADPELALRCSLIGSEGDLSGGSAGRCAQAHGYQLVGVLRRFFGAFIEAR